MSGFEVWRFVEYVADNELPRSVDYEWMVWRVGPMSGAEEWFATEAEAREYVAQQQREVAA